MASALGIDDKVRFLVLFLDADMKSTRISRLIDRSERTIRDWISKTRQGVDIRVVEEGRGSKKKVTGVKQKKVLRQIRENPQSATTRRLGAKNDISKSAIHRLLVQKGLKYLGLNPVPELSEDQKDARVEHCLDMTSDDGRRIYQTFYADEMGIRLSDVNKTKSWQDPIKKIKVELPEYDVKLNCWAAISYEGATSLEIFKDNLKRPVYQNIVNKHKKEMEELFPDGFYYIHDNHPTHKSVHGWMENNNLERIELPSYSPDLNVIENLWYTLKDCVARDGPRTETALRRSLKYNWEIITTPQNLHSYFESLHTRYFECIEENGERLPY
jgi:transposase